MAACTNNGGSIAKRAVTAALVGVLSVGTVPMAALAAGVDGIQTMASEWNQNATITKANNGKGGVVSDPANASFAAGSGKYLVPTEVTNNLGEKTEIDPNEFTLTYQPVNVISSSSSATDDDHVGLRSDWDYKYTDSDGNTQNVYFSSNGNVLDEGAAEAYFSGKLTGTGGAAITPSAEAYKVIITDSESKSTSFAFNITEEAAIHDVYAYVGDSSDKEIVYDGSDLLTNGNTTGTVQFANGDGTALSATNITWYNANGTMNTDGTATGAGSYSAVVDLTLTEGDTTTTLSGVKVSFTVAKYDLSTAASSISDIHRNGAGSYELIDDHTSVSFASSTSANGTIKGQIVPSALRSMYKFTDITAPSGAKYFDGSCGEYTATLAPVNASDPNVTGSCTFKFSVVDKNVIGLSTADNGLTDLYYGGQPAASGVTVNLTKGESFDASQVTVRTADGNVSWSGDQLEVTYKKGTKAIDASELSKTGKYTVCVRVKPYKDADGTWYGGYGDFQLTVNGDMAYDTNVGFYLDDKLSGQSGTVDYDGTDQLGRVSAKVKASDGTFYEAGKDFELVATKDGKEVDSVVDAGEYVITIKPLTFDWAASTDTDRTFTLTVNPLELNDLKGYFYAVTTDSDGNVTSYTNDAVAWTGSAVEVPAVQYKNADGDYVTLDKSLYNVVSIKKVKADGTTGATVKEAIDKGTYEVKIALSDAAKSNYSLKQQTFRFDVVKYNPFDDVESPAWYASVVSDAKYTGIVNGMSGTNLFAPEAQISRADAVCIIFNMAGGDNVLGDNMYTENGGWVTGFDDVDGNAYYAKALAWAHNAGVVNGYDGNFRPTDKVTREELAAMLANYAKATGDYEATDGSSLAGMSDASTVSDWAEGVVDWAVENGIMGNGGYVAGKSSIIRAEVAAMAVNYADKF